MSEAASVAFYTLLAVIPAIVAFVSAYGLFGDPNSLDGKLNALGGIIPGGAIDIIRAQIASLTAKGHKALGYTATLGLFVSLWSANSGINSLFDALNIIYHEDEKRSFIRRTLISLCLTVGTFLVMIVAVSGIVLVPIAMNFVGLGSVADEIINLLRWPLMLLLMVIALASIYRYGPSRELARWRWVSWGSTAAAFCWVGSSLLFSFYVANFGSYDTTYGSLGAVAGFMTWIWISAMVVLIGAELNAELERQTERVSLRPKEKPRAPAGALKGTSNRESPSCSTKQCSEQ